MPRDLQKSISKYFSKIKKQTPHLRISPSLSSTTSKIFSSYKNTKNLSFSFDRCRSRRPRQHSHHEDSASSHNDHHHHHHQNDEAATLADIDRFLLENFKSLYGNDSKNHNNSDSDSDDDAGGWKDRDPQAKILFDSQEFDDRPRDLCGSHRFLVSSGELSRSIMDDIRTSVEDSTRTTTTTTSTTAATAISNSVEGVRVKEVMPIVAGQDCIALVTASPNPYEDFRRSMKAMIEARLRQNQVVDWDFIEELLFSYLRLNEKKQHKYILGAFVDLIVILRENSSGSSREITESGRCRDSKEGEKGKGFWKEESHSVRFCEDYSQVKL